MTDEQNQIIKWLRIIGHTQDGDIVNAPVGLEVDGDDSRQIEDIVFPAADMIESMGTELAQVKRERDAAIRDLQGQCDVCVNMRDDSYCYLCSLDRISWEWRGPCGRNEGVRND